MSVPFSVSTNTVHCNGEVLKITNDAVLLLDSNTGKTITNAAEEVVHYVLALYPDRQIYYIDTNLDVDELVHDGQNFTHFGPVNALPEELRAFYLDQFSQGFV